MRATEKKYTTKELIRDVKRVRDLLGHVPSQREYDRLGYFSSRLLKYRLGSWKKVKQIVSYEEEIADKIYEIIEEEGPVTVPVIAKRVKMSEVEVRQIVAKILILRRKKPIGSKLKGKRRGYYILKTKGDFENEIRTLESRIKHIARRVAVLKQIEPYEYLDQLAFEWKWYGDKEEENNYEGD